MKKGIIGKKLGMTQIFDEAGNVIPVTVLEAGPCVVAQKKTVEKDGYEAVQDVYKRQKYVSVPSFNNACESASFCNSGYVDLFTLGKITGSDGIAYIESGTIIKSEFLQVLFICNSSCLDVYKRQSKYNSFSAVQKYARSRYVRSAAEP